VTAFADYPYRPKATRIYNLPGYFKKKGDKDKSEPVKKR
jgi:hypothetical protein